MEMDIKAWCEKAATATEQELRVMEKPWPRTKEDLDLVIKTLAERQHDYGTCVYAVGYAALAAANFIHSTLGTTGFQAGASDFVYLRGSRLMDGPFAIVNYGDLLYVQYMEEDRFNMSARDIIFHHKQWFADEARKKISEMPDTFPAMKEHWTWLASLAPETTTEATPE